MSPAVRSGRNLWHQHVRTVVTLSEQMRQASDPEYAQHLEAFRRRCASDADVTFFNMRVCGPGFDAVAAVAASAGSTAGLNSLMPIVVYANKDRCALNRAIGVQCVQRFHLRYPSVALETQFFLVHGNYVVTEHPSKRVHAVQTGTEMYRHLSSRKTRSRDHQLFLYVGMPVLVMQNLHIPSGIAHGSQAVVQRIQLRERVGTAAPVINCHGVRVLTAADVACVVLRLVQAESGMRRFSDVQLAANEGMRLGPGEFAVFVGSEPLKDLGGASISARLYQLPIRPAFALTAHKVQGMTLRQLIYGAAASAGPAANYVVLSRLQERAGLFLLHPLQLGNNKGRSSDEVNELQTELVRQEALTAATAEQHQAFFAQFENLLRTRETSSAAAHSTNMQLEPSGRGQATELSPPAPLPLQPLLPQPDDGVAPMDTLSPEVVAQPMELTVDEEQVDHVSPPMPAALPHDQQLDDGGVAAMDTASPEAVAALPVSSPVAQSETGAAVEGHAPAPAAPAAFSFNFHIPGEEEEEEENEDQEEDEEDSEEEERRQRPGARFIDDEAEED
jgi:hypothetical protein